MERTATFCPVQAVLDDAHIGMIKGLARQPVFTDSTIPEVLEQTRRVMTSSTKLFTRFVRSALRAGEIAPPYQFESRDMADETLFRAQERLNEILSLPPNHIEKEIVEKVFQQIPGLLKKLQNS